MILSTTLSTAQCWDAVVAGYSFTIAKTPQGKLYTAGTNFYGQLGNGTNGANAGSNTLQAVGNDTWSTMAAGDYHALAIKPNGTLWAWGGNGQGALGDGTNIDKNIPIQIGTDTNWASVTAGFGYSLAIKTNGTLWAWGENLYGQLGLGTNGPAADTNFPQQVGTATDWKMVSAGSQHTVAVKNNGTLWVWGRNEVGELGLGFNQIPKNVPTQLGTATDWDTAAAGEYCTAAIKTDRSLWTWGDNSAGAIGDNTTTNRVSPVRIGFGGSWEKVSNGFHMVATQTNGSIWSWGSNMFGQVGNNSLVNRRTPVQISNSNNWRVIAASANATLAIDATGNLYGVGLNIGGQLADGTNTDRRVLTLSTCTALGLEASELAADFAVYPNPVSDVLTIRAPQTASIKIYNMLGSLMLTRELNLSENSIDLSSFQNGMYMLTIERDRATRTYKVMVRH